MCERGMIFLCERSGKGDMEEKKVKKGKPCENGMLRTTRFTIRLDEKEHQEFLDKANKKGMSISEYLRYLVKKDK